MADEVSTVSLSAVIVDLIKVFSGEFSASCNPLLVTHNATKLPLLEANCTSGQGEKLSYLSLGEVRDPS